MAQMTSISGDEFHRMQTQLLELRDVNYQLDDKCKRLERENLSLQDVNSQLSKDLDKSNKTLSRSKKGREVEMLVGENESLQRKLISQEEDFRLQNETLIKELTQLVSTNESLEAELQKLKAGGGVASADDSANQNKAESSVQDELRRLQAENSVLQGMLTESDKKHMVEVQALKQSITELEGQCVRLLGKRGTPVGGAGNRDSDSVDGKDEASLDNEEENADNESGDKIRSADEGSFVISNTIGQSINQSASSIEQDKLINELKMSLNMEREEKRLIKEELNNLQAQQKSSISGAQDQVEKLQEKLRKKQESYVQLQTEKEAQFKEASEKYNRFEKDREMEIQRMSDLIDSLKSDLSLSNKSTDEKTAGYRARVEELESKSADLERKMKVMTTESSQRLTEQSERSASAAKELETRIEELNKSIEDLRRKLEDSERAHSSTTEQMLTVQAESEKIQQALDESKKVAEKRKTLLDELAIKYQEEVEQHRAERSKLQDQCTTLTQQINNTKHEITDKSEECEMLKVELQQFKSQLQSLETAKSYLDRRLNEAEAALEKQKSDSDAELTSCKHAHTQEIDRLNMLHQEQNELNEKEKTVQRTETEKLLAENERLKQEVKDSIDERKLHEKKGATVLKDLKRQFQGEKRRADKLQEKLQEYLNSDTRSRQSVEDLFRSTDSIDKQRVGDGSSVCSWSPSVVSRDNTLAQTPEEDGEYLTQKQENEDLLMRIAQIQQQKWTLEEKVLHLESSNAAMAQDLLEKTAVIDHYIMDRRQPAEHHSMTSPTHPSPQGGVAGGLIGGVSLKKVMLDLVKTDDPQRDINKRLQRMLEETLTKNMHLQQDLEAMSKEVVRLSKVPHSLPQSPSSSTLSSITEQSTNTEASNKSSTDLTTNNNAPSS